MKSGDCDHNFTAISVMIWPSVANSTVNPALDRASAVSSAKVAFSNSKRIEYGMVSPPCWSCC